MDRDEIWNDEADEFTPLKRGDRLFINDEWRAHLDNLEGYGYAGYKRSGFLSYAAAYLEAADRLVKTLRERRSLPDSHSDALVIPIVFLYRHYLELTLKDLIIIGHEKYGNPPKDVGQLGHKINTLWQELKPLLLLTHLPPKRG